MAKDALKRWQNNVLGPHHLQKYKPQVFKVGYGGGFIKRLVKHFEREIAKFNKMSDTAPLTKWEIPEAALDAMEALVDNLANEWASKKGKRGYHVLRYFSAWLQLEYLEFVDLNRKSRTISAVYKRVEKDAKKTKLI